MTLLQYFLAGMFTSFGACVGITIVVLGYLALIDLITRIFGDYYDNGGSNV